MSIVDEYRALHNPGTIVFTLELTNDLYQAMSDDFSFEVCLRLFSLQEQLQIRSKQFKIKELAYRLFTRCILNLCLGVDDLFREIKFSYNQYGKPFIVLDDGSINGFQYNASTSNDIVSLVVQYSPNAAIGIDLSHSQQNVAVESCVEDFKQIFDRREYRLLSGIEDGQSRYLMFNQYWTLKEAFTKLLGCGLNVELSHFAFALTTELLHKPASVVKNEAGYYFSTVAVDWNANIEVDPAALYVENSPYITGMKNEFYCLSGRYSSIVMSVISQSPIKDKISVQELNMSKLIQEYLL